MTGPEPVATRARTPTLRDVLATILRLAVTTLGKCVFAIYLLITGVQVATAPIGLVWPVAFIAALGSGNVPGAIFTGALTANYVGIILCLSGPPE